MVIRLVFTGPRYHFCKYVTVYFTLVFRIGLVHLFIDATLPHVTHAYRVFDHPSDVIFPLASQDLIHNQQSFADVKHVNGSCTVLSNG